MEKSYPNCHWKLQQLSRRLGKESEGPMDTFAKLQGSAPADGALSARTKELISLGIAICARCSGRISQHVHDALLAGATRERITETLAVAILMGRAPSMLYACEALEALEQSEAVGVDSARPAETDSRVMTESDVGGTREGMSNEREAIHAS